MKACAPVLLAIGLVLAVPLPARADASRTEGFRCGRRLVGTGDHMLEVRNRCGEPDFVTQRVEKRKVKVKVRRWIVDHVEEVSEEDTVDVTVDEWTYDLGPERFVRYVAFENGRVVGVTTGNYGTKDTH